MEVKGRSGFVPPQRNRTDMSQNNQSRGEHAEILAPEPEAITRAARLLEAGELVAFPTETVYGLGADARNDRAVAEIFAVKGRPQFNPLIIHVPDLATAMRLGRFSPTAHRLGQRFWPGPLTLVVPRAPECPISHLASAGLDSVALRVPDHRVARDLLTRFAGPIAAPSANLSGRLSPTEAEHVEEMLGESIALILDGDACPAGLESTILSCLQDPPRLLRPGALTVEEIEEALGLPLTREAMGQTGQEASENKTSPTAPGQLSSHYAPRARLRLNCDTSAPGEMLLAFGPNAPKGVPGLNLSPSGDLREAAANLFAYLHILDATGVATINVMPIPDHGLGTAINDRLRRAAHR